MSMIADIQTLRTATGASVAACRIALVVSGGDLAAAQQHLVNQAATAVQGRAGRAVAATRIESYVHHTGTTAALAEVGTETDFVARTDEVRDLARNVALQAVATGGTLPGLLTEPWIKDPARTVQDLVTDVSARVGERVAVTRVARL